MSSYSLPVICTACLAGVVTYFYVYPKSWQSLKFILGFSSKKKPKNKQFRVLFKSPTKMISGKEIKTKLLRSDCDLVAFRDAARHLLKEKFSDDIFEESQMDTHLTLMENEEFKIMEPQNKEEWEAYQANREVTQAVTQEVIQRALALENTLVRPNIKIGKKSIGLEFPIPCHNMNAHMTIAYYKDGLPINADVYLQRMLIEKR